MKSSCAGGLRAILAVCHGRVGRTRRRRGPAQETLLRGYRSLGTLLEPEKFAGWLTGIAIRTCLDWLKAKRTHAGII